MKKTIIEIKDLSKSYHIKNQKEIKKNNSTSVKQKKDKTKNKYNPPTKKNKNIDNINIYNFNASSKYDDSIGYTLNNLLPKKKEIIKFSTYYIDYELNVLPYEIAFSRDNRTFCQYYFSLLKIRQILLFALCSGYDYNPRGFKISFFIITLLFNFMVNLIFFDDKMIHQIYIDKGIYNLKFQKKNILISAGCSIIFNILLTYSFLPNRNIIEYKIEAIKFHANREKVVGCLKYQIFLFYLFIIPFSIFCWYYISCFCAVFVHTQLYYIITSLISFGIILLYPFLTCIFPGIFRIISLKGNKRKFLYIISIILQIF